MLLNCVSEQPEKPKSYVRILFADPSLAFTLPRPISLPERSWTYNNLSRAITLWIVSFLTHSASVHGRCDIPFTAVPQA